MTMPAQSPSASAPHLSPRQAPISPNTNPFAPLSPDHGVPGQSFIPERKFVYYSRAKLLLIAKECKDHAWSRPPTLGALETWYGPPPTTKSASQTVQDPAIASIGPSGAGGQLSRRGGPSPGFGEGFGFGGGIGGNARGLGRGGRQTQRRPLEGGTRSDDPRDQAKAVSRSDRTKGVSDEKRDRVDRSRHDDGEWRRNERVPASVNHREHGELASDQPAWMNDGYEDGLEAALVTPSGSDPLIKFTPGEDMIAVHKRNMKTRGTEATWRADKGLVSFFGDVENKASTGKLPTASREFNAERYLLPKKQDSESIESSSSNTSRFQRFFAAAPSALPDSVMKTPNEDRSPQTSFMGSANPQIATLMDTLKAQPRAQRSATASFDHDQDQPGALDSFSGYDPEQYTHHQFDRAQHFMPTHHELTDDSSAHPDSRLSWPQNAYGRAAPAGQLSYDPTVHAPMSSYHGHDSLGRRAPDRAGAPQRPRGYLDQSMPPPDRGFHFQRLPTVNNTLHETLSYRPPNISSQPASELPPSLNSGEPNPQAQRLLATLFAGARRS